LVQLIVCFLLLVFSTVSFASDDLLERVVKDGNGLRAMSMGDAYVALGEGESAIFYNPAGLSIPGETYAHQVLDLDSNVYQRYYLHSLYTSPVGVAFVSAKNLAGQSVGVWNFGYGRRGGRGIDWGLNVKSFTYENGVRRIKGMSTDFGLKARVFSFMNMGFVAHDAYKNKDVLPTTYTGGLAFYTPGKRIILTSDWASQYKEGKAVVTSHYGTELEIAQGLRLRGGLSDGVYTAGVALIFSGMALEYGFRDRPDHPEEKQYMVSVRFGAGLETYKPQERYSLFKPDAFAEFALGDNLTSGKSEASLLGGTKLGTNDLLSLIHDAVKDKTCEGFIVKLYPSGSSLTSIGLIQEVREELVRAKSKGKKVYVYLDGWATLPDYYLASVADKIYMSELGSFSHLGIELQLVKTRELFKNFGFETETVASGRFKDSLNSESPTINAVERHYLETLVGQVYSKVITDIRASRPALNWDKANTYFDGRIFMAPEALQAGLIDSLTSYSGMLEDLEDKAPDRGFHKSSLFAFEPVRDTAAMFSFNKIAVMEVDGEIGGGENATDILFGGKSTGAASIEAQVAAIEKDFTIKGVILRVNSPGGSVLASDDIYRAIKRLEEARKTVYASFGNMAASGGYYVSLGAKKIYANPGTLTGSVGVISSRMNYAGLEEKLDIDVDTVKTGQNMDLMSPHKRSTDEQKAMLKVHQDAFYQRFVDLVQENRQMTDTEVYNVAQGQVFSGEQAVSLHVVDEIGGLYDAVDQMADDLDIDSPDVVFMRTKERYAIPFSRLNAMTKLLFKGLTLMNKLPLPATK